MHVESRKQQEQHGVKTSPQEEARAGSATHTQAQRRLHTFARTRLSLRGKYARLAPQRTGSVSVHVHVESRSSMDLTTGGSQGKQYYTHTHRRTHVGVRRYHTGKFSQLATANSLVRRCWCAPPHRAPEFSRVFTAVTILPSHPASAKL